jgi:hypothetical protein
LLPIGTLGKHLFAKHAVLALPHEPTATPATWQRTGTQSRTPQQADNGVWSY